MEEIEFHVLTGRIQCAGSSDGYCTSGTAARRVGTLGGLLLVQFIPKGRGTFARPRRLARRYFSGKSRVTNKDEFSSARTACGAPGVRNSS